MHAPCTFGSKAKLGVGRSGVPDIETSERDAKVQCRQLSSLRTIPTYRRPPIRRIAAQTLDRLCIVDFISRLMVSNSGPLLASKLTIHILAEVVEPRGQRAHYGGTRRRQAEGPEVRQAHKDIRETSACPSLVGACHGHLMPRCRPFASRREARQVLRPPARPSQRPGAALWKRHSDDSSFYRCAYADAHQGERYTAARRVQRPGRRGLSCSSILKCKACGRISAKALAMLQDP